MILKRKYLLIFIFVILISNPVAARTRQKSIENYFDDLRISDDGYANTLDGEVNIPSTTEVLEIANLIQYDINNSLDILLFYQNSQNNSGGFSAKINDKVTWDDTIAAIRGLNYLEVNQTQFQNWEIYSYVNSTAMDVLFTTIIRNNVSMIVMQNLTLPLINYWYDYISASYSLGFYPIIDMEGLVKQLHNYQFSNGSYNDFESAVTSIHLLSLLGTIPRDPDLSSKYIRAYIQKNGAFSNIQGGKTSLYSSYLGIRTLYELNQIREIEYLDELVIFILNLQNANSGFTEVGSTLSTLKNTWYAVNSLFMLEKLNELLSPDVLQSEGFISYNWSLLPIAFSVLIIWRKNN